MENEDAVPSTRRRSNASPSSNTPHIRRKSPKCARCLNHKLQVPLKSHKRYCRYRTCTCPKCKLTAERQVVMAKQTAMKRALAQDQNRLKKPGEQVDPPPFGVDDDRLSSVPQPATSLEDSYEGSSSGSPISNHESNGRDAAYAGDQAHYDIRAMRFWNAVRMVESGQTYCCTGYSPSTEAPTYDGQVPYIGLAPPTSDVHLRPLLHPLNAHVPVTGVPASPDSPPERPAT